MGRELPDSQSRRTGCLRSRRARGGGSRSGKDRLQRADGVVVNPEREDEEGEKLHVFRIVVSDEETDPLIRTRSAAAS